MKTRASHVGKTASERNYYFKQIRTIESDPTVEEKSPFSESDDTKRDYSISPSARRRPVPWKEQVKDHFRENWLPWIITGALIVFSYFVFESKITIARIGTKLEGVSSDVDDLKKADRETTEKIHQQDLKIQENKIRLEIMEKGIPKSKQQPK